MTDTSKTIDEETAELQASNSSRLNVLSMQQIGIDIQTLTLRHLVETLFPTDEERAEMNLSFQKRLAEELDNAEAQVDAINLQRAAQQAQQGSGLIIPGAPVIDV
jgi:ribosomal protein L18E